MTIDVLLDEERIPISKDVFKLLLENSVASYYVRYKHAIEQNSISYDDLNFLSIKGEIPLPLFFAPFPLAKAQVDAKIRKLLQGVSRKTFQLGTREEVQLRDIELIVKDLLRKQEVLKRYDSTLTKNPIIGLLKKPGASAESDAAHLMSEIDLTHTEIRSCKKKEDALDLIIRKLEKKQILISRSVQNYMPQRLSHVSFSGITIRDSKIPYIFLAGGDHGDFQEPVGRTIFTLILMTVLIARKVFKPVTWNAQSTQLALGYEYDVTGAILMPSNQMNSAALTSLADIRRVADEFKVTPSAVTIRALRIGRLSEIDALTYLGELRSEFLKITQPKAMRRIRPENAVRKYASREFSRRMLRALDNKLLSEAEFCRIVCLNKLTPMQIIDLRRAVS